MNFHHSFLSPAMAPILTSACLAAAIPTLVLAQDDKSTSHKFTLGTYLSEGDYGADEDTSIGYFPVTYELTHFPWVLSVTVPYLKIEGPGDVFLETGNIGRGRGMGNDFIDEDGLGDVFVSGSYQFPPLFESGLFVDFSMQAKLPTADETKDLGTGELDYGTQLDLYMSQDRNTWFSTIGYRWRGKTDLYDLNDSAYASLGFMRQFGESVYLGMVYDYRQKASQNSFKSHELMPFVSWNLNSRWNLMVYSIAGFTDSSADRTVGAQISYTLP